MPDVPSVAVSMELLRRGAEATSLASDLADRLEMAMPDQVEVERRRLRRETEVRVALGNEHFRLEIRPKKVTATIDHVVRDVSVRTDHVSFDEWYDRLVVALEREATTSTHLRLALEDALK